MNTLEIPEHLKAWLKSDEGRDLLRLLNESFPTNEPAFDKHDTHNTAYKQGQRDAMLSINAAAGFDPHAPGAETPEQQLDNLIRIEDLKA